MLQQNIIYESSSKRQVSTSIAQILTINHFNRSFNVNIFTMNCAENDRAVIRWNTRGRANCLTYKGH
jgi:hypothetical protein